MRYREKLAGINSTIAALYLRYGERSSEKKMQLEVSENNIEFIGLGYVVSEAKPKSGQSAVITVLIAAIGLLIVINALWFIILRKKFAKKQPGLLLRCLTPIHHAHS